MVTYVKLRRTYRCPCCSAHFPTKSQVAKHINHPNSPCVRYLDPLLNAPPVAPLCNPTPPPSSPETTPFNLMDLEDTEELDCNKNSPSHDHTSDFLREPFHGASKIYGKGENFMDHFDRDDLAKDRSGNLYYPFASRQEWEIASFLLRSNLSMRAIDEFLNLSLVCITLIYVSFFLIFA